MDVESVFNAGGVIIPNPNYIKSKKNTQPKYITVTDLDKTKNSSTSYMADISYTTTVNDMQNIVGTEEEAYKYLKYGIVNNRFTPNLDAQLANAQGTGEKLWNSLQQTVWSEIVLGTLNGFADLYDVITGAVFSSDNDYQNPVSRYLEEVRENFRNNNPIYVDPDKHLTTGGLTDAGWWLSNLPNVASSLTLLIPGAGTTKAMSMVGKAFGVNKAIGWTRRAVTGARNIKNIEEAEKLGKIAKFINKESTVTAANRMFEKGLTASAMRTLENYQEARQTYNDMYQEASKALANMSNEDYEKFKAKYQDELEGVNLDDRDTVAKKIAHNSATKTFAIDYGNLLFDVVQVYALRNPLKLTKNMRTTAATRKAERLARRNAGKSAEEIAKLDANTGLGTKFKNYINDHVGALGVFGAKSSEGIEEAVNYIAQQEGMYYGRVMIDPKNNPETAFSSRLTSYLASPELHDAAFWGVMGGVVFQGAGSGFNRAYNAISGKIKERKTKNDKTKEDVNTNWRDRFETAENKRRVAEINARQQSYNTLVERLTQIEENKDPFNVDSEDNTKQAILNSDEAIRIARERAIDEYIVPMTFRAIEAGNFNTLKAYLRDENVRKALADKGVIDSTNNDVESLIQRMDEIEQIYNDNIIAIDGISQGQNIPFEYIQIIARDNALAQIQMQRLDTQLSNYEVSAENNRRRFGANLDSSIDYKSAVELAVTTKRLAELRARKQAILEDENYAKSLDGQNRLKDIDNEIKTINNNLYNDNWGTNGQYTSLSNKLARLIWSNVTSTQGKYDENGKFIQDRNSDSYLGALNAVAARDFNNLKELTGIDFATTDEAIISLFGEDNQSGAYQSLSDDLGIAFDLEKGLDKLAPNLNQDYQNIAAIKLAKLQQQSLLANTTETINTAVNEIHNYMNEARRKAIEISEKDIFDIADKYGTAEVEAYIFENEDIENISEADKKKIDEALEVLNLTTDSNRVLGENLKNILFRKTLDSITENAITSEENAINNQAISDTENADLNNPITDTQQDSTTNESSQIDDISTDNQADQSEKQKLSLSVNIDDEVEVNTNIGENDNHYDYVEDENGILTLSIPDGSSVPDSLLRNSAVYEGYDSDAEHSDADREISSHPKLKKDENGKYHIIEKGQIIYYRNHINNTITSESTENNITEQEPISTNLFTGEVVEQEVKAEETINNELVAPISITDEYIENIENNVQKEANDLFKNRDKTLDVNIVLENIAKQLKDKHKSDENPNIVEAAINRSIKILRARATRKGLIKSAAEVLSSSVTEMPNGKYDFSQAYKDAVVKMIEDYCRENGIREINGKRYINLEDTLRRINTLFEDKAIANMMFGAINAYLQTKNARDKFVVMDNTTNAEEFLANVQKSAAQRSTERIGNIADRTNRVAIDKLFENPTKEFLDTFNSLNKGDKLSIKLINGEIQLLKNNVVVGTLPKPLVNSKTGAYYKYNNGWRTEVSKENGIVVSNLKDIFENILLEDSETNNIINDIITELNYGEPNNSRKEELINKLYNILQNDLNLVVNIISESTDKQEVVEHLCKLWKYFNGKAESPEEQRAYIADSLDKWFEKLYNEYDYINSLGEKINNTDGIEATIENITSGEIIRIVDADNRGDGNNYDKYTQSNSAFANPNEITLGIVSFTNEGELETVDGRIIQHDKLGKTGTPTIILPNKNGVDNYIIGISVKVNDNNLTGDAKLIMSAIKKELNYLINKHIKEGNYNDLFNFLRELFYNTNKKGMFAGLGTNTGLLAGVVVHRNKETDNFINISSKNGVAISIHNNRDKTFNFKNKGEFNFATENTNRTLNNPEDAKIFKDILNEIINSAYINIARTYIESDSKGYSPSGFATKNSNGGFNIYIPNSENPSQAFNKTYNSFQDAVINGGLIRVNTRVENGSNYRRKGKNQAANQIMEVSISEKTSSPVESITTQNINTSSTVENTLKDEAISDKANAILNKVLTDEQLKLLNDLHLLPKNIIFDENFNKQDKNGNWQGLNARANLKQGTTIVGKRWVQMFNEEGEFSGFKPGVQRKQAIRKLIHEQLHHILEKGKRRDEYLNKIEEIYNDFRNSLDSLNEDERAIMNKYLFSEDVANGNKRVALEEFLVESLTSEELVNYLNSVDAEVEKKKLSNNLWQRILKLLSDIFGWEVRKGSLREKELYSLQGQLKNIREALSENNVAENIIMSENETNETNINNEIETETKDNSSINFDDAFDSIFGNDIETRGSSVTEKSDYTTEMQSIKDKAIADGTFMKAPNGNPTNLNERQWLQVRTKNFINWFGDWINNPSEASKVVDENGEPLVVYHGSDANNITSFSLEKAKHNIGIFLAESKNVARSYVDWMSIDYYIKITNSELDNFNIYESYNEYKNRILEFEKDADLPFSCLISEEAFNAKKAAIVEFNKHVYNTFVNLKNPLIIDAKKRKWNAIFFKGVINTTESLAIYAKKYGHDGVIVTNVEDNGLKNQNDMISGYEITNEYIVFNPNQIKSATSNTGEFSTTNNDIRHSSITEQPVRHQSVAAFSERLPIDQQAKFIASVFTGDISTACR